MKVSNYKAKKNEANFGKPLKTQVTGGSHITFELISKKGPTFYMTRWPKGLPGHDDPPNALRFPHGLIKRGESLKELASRLVAAQLGMGVKEVKFAYWDSYLDANDHWHVEPGLIVELKGDPRVPNGASEVITFELNDIPKMSFWSKKDFLDVIEEHFPDLPKRKK